MSVKKPAAKAKHKSANSDTPRAAKSRPAAHGKDETQGKEATRVMDARSGKDRRQDDRRHKEMSVEVERRAGQRRVKVSRRRQIDPTTCERDYSPEELEFMNALDEYKRRSGRMFPTCSEILEVFRALGYQRPALPTADSPAVVGQPDAALSAPSMSNEQSVVRGQAGNWPSSPVGMLV